MASVAVPWSKSVKTSASNWMSNQPGSCLDLDSEMSGSSVLGEYRGGALYAIEKGAQGKRLRNNLTRMATIFRWRLSIAQERSVCRRPKGRYPRSGAKNRPELRFMAQKAALLEKSAALAAESRRCWGEFQRPVKERH